MSKGSPSSLRVSVNEFIIPLVFKPSAGTDREVSCDLNAIAASFNDLLRPFEPVSRDTADTPRFSKDVVGEPGGVFSGLS